MVRTKNISGTYLFLAAFVHFKRGHRSLQQFKVFLFLILLLLLLLLFGSSSWRCITPAGQLELNLGLLRLWG